MSNYMFGKHSDFLLSAQRKKGNENEQVTKKHDPKQKKKNIRSSPSLVPAMFINASVNRFGPVPNRHVASSKHSFDYSSQVNSSVASTISAAKSVNLHTMLTLTFETFLLQIDEVITKMRKETPRNTGDCVLQIRNYKDICEKFRAEILIAIDKIDLLSLPPNKNIDEQAEFAQSMKILKVELAKLRTQYHQALKKYGSTIV